MLYWNILEKFVDLCVSVFGEQANPRLLSVDDNACAASASGGTAAQSEAPVEVDQEEVELEPEVTDENASAIIDIEVDEAGVSGT